QTCALPIYGGRRRQALLARGAAQGGRRGGVRLLHEPRVAQGPRGAGPPFRGATLLVASLGSASPRRGRGAAGWRRGRRRVLRVPAAGEPARCVGFGSGPSAQGP